MSKTLGSFTTRSLLAACAAAFALVGLVASPAQASAFGGSNFGPSVIYKGATLPMGTYWAELNGTGTYVNYVKGYPNLNAPVGNICNWNITAEFFTASGAWYKTISGPIHYGCNSYWNQGPADVLWVKGYMAKGKMCSTLKSNGGRVTSVCHSIY